MPARNEGCAGRTRELKPRFSAGLFLIMYASSFAGPLLGGAAWDATGRPPAAFLTLAAGGVLMVLLGVGANLGRPRQRRRDGLIRGILGGTTTDKGRFDREVEDAKPRGPDPERWRPAGLPKWDERSSAKSGPLPDRSAGLFLEEILGSEQETVRSTRVQAADPRAAGRNGPGN